MKRHVVVVALWLVAAGVAGLAGQQDTLRFTAGVELARLDIEVTDAQGRPIEDLRPDEVEIIEDGQRHPVVFFQHIHEPAGSSPRPQELGVDPDLPPAEADLQLVVATEVVRVDGGGALRTV